ncbi:unnamed protein product [Camellia sinensis]
MEACEAKTKADLSKAQRSEVYSIKWIRRDNNGGTRTNINNRTSLPLNHPRQNCLCNLGSPFNIDFNQISQQLLVHLIEKPRIRIQNSNIINQNSNIQTFNGFTNPINPFVQISKEINNHSLDLGFPEFGSDRLRNLLEFIGVSTNENQIQTFMFLTWLSSLAMRVLV